MQKVCYKMPINTWVELKEKCPIDLGRLSSHASSFNAHVGVRISLSNLSRAKRSLIEARGQLELMVTSLNQILYDRKILKSRVDEILHMWFMDNLGRLMRKIDEKERDLLIIHDNPNDTKSEVGVAHLSAYAKVLKIVSQAVIFESLIKATEEYNEIPDGGTTEKIPYVEEIQLQKKNSDGKLLFFDKSGNETIESTHKGKIKGEVKTINNSPVMIVEEHEKTEELRIEKNTRTFLYILFHVLQVTLFTLGSLSREKTSGATIKKKDNITQGTGSWRDLLSSRGGQSKIAQAHQEDTGERVRINLPSELREGSEEEGDENQEVLFDETYEENSEDEEDEEDA